MNARALAELSSTSTPTNRTPDGVNSRAAADSSGASWWQTEHHDPQKFSTTTCPRSARRLSFAPVTVWPDTPGKAGRWPAVNVVTPICSDAPDEVVSAAEQPATSRAATALKLSIVARIGRATLRYYIA